MAVTIYHNPRCSKSRQTLELLKSHGIKPKVIEYIINTPSEEKLRQIIAMLDMSAHELIRPKEAADAGLKIAALTEDKLIKYMVKYPQIIQRPIVVANHSAAICRPPEKVLDIL